MKVIKDYEESEGATVKVNGSRIAFWALGVMNGVIILMLGLLLARLDAIGTAQEKTNDKLGAVDSRVSTIEGKLSNFPQINAR